MENVAGVIYAFLKAYPWFEYLVLGLVVLIGGWWSWKKVKQRGIEGAAYGEARRKRWEDRP